MMSRLLVSFCNTLPQGFPLAAYDFDSGDLEWIEPPESEAPVGGATGICWADSECFVLLQRRVPGWPTTLAAYGPDLRVRRTVRLKRVSDGHSMIFHDGALLVASSGTNELVRVTLDRNGEVVSEEPVWSPGNAGFDHDHLNSVVYSAGRLYASLFGPKTEDGNSLQRQGQVVEIASGSTIRGELTHPHSLAEINGVLYWLESSRGQVWRLGRTGSSFQSEILFHLDGYLRGIVGDNGSLCIGASAQRLRSKSQGTLVDPPSGNRDGLHCLLHRVDLSSGAVETRDLTPFGREIFDLALLPSDCPYPRAGCSPDAMIRRQLAYDAEHLKALDDLRVMIERHEALIRQCSTPPESSPQQPPG